MEALAYPQSKTFEAAVTWARTQGTVPAPETGHAVRAVIDEALAAKEEGKEKVILFNYSGHGLLDLSPMTRTSTASCWTEQTEDG
jgi:tryptophan synthase beta chain